MKDKKGFTIIELLAVLLVLGMLMVFAYPAIFKTEKAAEEVLNKAEERNLKEAAKLVAIDLDDYMSPIYNCNKGWMKDENKCNKPYSYWESASVTVKDLIDNKYMEDKNTHLDKNIVVRITGKDMYTSIYNFAGRLNDSCSGSWISSYCVKDNGNWITIKDVPLSKFVEYNEYTDSTNHCKKNDNKVSIYKENGAIKVDLTYVMCNYNIEVDKSSITSTNP